MEDEMKRWNKIKSPAFQKKLLAQTLQKRICYIVTKQKSHSWMDDMHTFERADITDRIYN
jgi:hypothetical protein